jgi:ABC-type cobalt transport system substrate-binding protein
MNKKILLAALLLIVLVGVVVFVSKQPATAPYANTEQEGDEEIEGTEAEQIIPSK